MTQRTPAEVRKAVAKLSDAEARLAMREKAWLTPEQAAKRGILRSREGNELREKLHGVAGG